MVYNTPHWMRKLDAAFDAKTSDGTAAMKLVTTARMRALEQAAVDAGATWSGLMEQAGWGVRRVVLRLLGPAGERRVLVLVGPATMAAMGWSPPAHLHDAGRAVSLYISAPPGRRPTTNWLLPRARDPEYAGGRRSAADRQLRRHAGGCDLVVDGLLGMGISRMVEGRAGRDRRGGQRRPVGAGCSRWRQYACRWS